MAVININDFKKNRSAKLRDFKKILWIIFIAYMFAYAINHYQDYTVASLQRTFSYISYVNNEGAITDDILVDIDRTTLYDIFSNGVVTFDRDILTYTNPVSKVDAELSYAYQNSDMAVGTNIVIVFDRQGTEYSVSNNYGEIYLGKTTSPILNIVVAKNDNYVIITDEASYIGAITVFDANNKEIFKWSTSTYNVVSASIDDKGEKLMALCIFQENTQIKSSAILFDIKNGEIIQTKTFINEIPIQSKFLDNGNFVILCRDLICILNDDFDIIYEEPSNNLSAYNFDSSHNILYAKDNGANIEITIVDKNGNIVSTKNLSETIKAYSMSNDIIYILTTDFVYKFDLELNLLDEIKVENTMMKIIYKNELFGVLPNKVVRLF